MIMIMKYQHMGLGADYIQGWKYFMHILNIFEKSH